MEDDNKEVKATGEENTGSSDENKESVKDEVVSSEEKNTSEKGEEKEEVIEPKDEETDEESAEDDKDDVEDEDTKDDEEESEADKTLKEVNPKEANIEQATNVLKDKGFDYAELSKEFNEKGEISKETRDKLAEVGITGEIIDNYIEGQKARVERELDELSLCVGGREKMNEVIRWASQNISDDEKASINGITDANVMKMILKDLKNRMEEKEGKVPETQLNGEGGKPAVEIYESQAQMFEAIRDPKYKTDEAYRAKVMKKIQASREAGIDLGI